jgi:hypothetical protein
VTFRPLTITTHPSTVNPVIVPDLGFDVPAAGGTTSLTDPHQLDRASNSDSLRALATDAAFPSGLGTISLDDGGRPIPPTLASARLDALTRFEEDWIVVASGPGTALHDTTVAIGP